jgi:hypothetical protein
MGGGKGKLLEARRDDNDEMMHNWVNEKPE